MAKHIWTVLCSKGITDTLTKQLSMIDTLEAVTITQADELNGEPITIQFPMQLISLCMRSDPETPEIFKSRIYVDRPNGERSDIQEMELSLEAGVRARSIVSFGGINIVGQGIYWFVMEYYDDTLGEWKRQSETPLEVTFKPEEQPQQ